MRKPRRRQMSASPRTGVASRVADSDSLGKATERCSSLDEIVHAVAGGRAGPTKQRSAVRKARQRLRRSYMTLQPAVVGRPRNIFEK